MQGEDRAGPAPTEGDHVRDSDSQESKLRAVAEVQEGGGEMGKSGSFTSAALLGRNKKKVFGLLY